MSSMSPEAELAYRKENGERLGRKWLSTIYLWVMIVIAILVLLQVLLTAVLYFQCATVFGLSISGVLVETDSLTCHNPEVPRLFIR